MDSISRRRFLATGALAAGTAAFGPGLLRDALAAPAVAGEGPYGPLLPPDANSLMLPEGFRSRLIARRLEPVPGTSYSFPIFPDGQATYPTADGGWILVTNSESLAITEAGTSAIRFAADGAIVDAYPILRGTEANCAGGPTPWGTWLSCEEYEGGRVWECDPDGTPLDAQARPALGTFNHEAVAVDPVGRRLYLTEDEGDGGFYRFTPDVYPGLDDGLLEVAVVSGGSVGWVEVPDPNGILGMSSTPTREQVPEMTTFDGGEGIWHARGVVYFTTKGDKRVWAYTPANERIEVLYDDDTAPGSALDAVDNVTVSEAGEIYVCEDGGNLEIGLISPERAVSPFLRFVGADHADSEVCGAVFDPSGTRLYLTSQRAFPATPPLGEVPAPAGAVYEVSGPFRQPSSGAGAGSVGAGNPQPAGEQRPGGPLNPGDTTRDASNPALAVRLRRRMRRAPVVDRGVPLRVRTSEDATVALVLDTPNLLREAADDGRSSDRPRTIQLATNAGLAMTANRTRLVRLPLGRRARVRLRRRPGTLEARLTATAVDPAGNRSIVTEAVRIGPARPSRRRRRRDRRDRSRRRGA